MLSPLQNVTHSLKLTFVLSKLSQYHAIFAFYRAGVVINPVNPLVLEQKRKSYIIYTLLCWGGPSVAVGICVTLQLMKIGNVGYGEIIKTFITYASVNFRSTHPLSGH